MEFAGCANDGAFGPSVHGCRGDFDFTLKFEKIFFSLIPSSLIVAISAPRLIALVRGTPIVTGAWYQLTKVVSLFLLTPFSYSLPPLNRTITSALAFETNGVIGVHLDSCGHPAGIGCAELQVQDFERPLSRVLRAGFSCDRVRLRHKLL